MSLIICPDCGRQLEYYETEIIDNNTYLVVDHFTEEIQKDNNSSISSNTPICPTCGSPNVKKISITERAVSVGILGVFSNKINKSFKCGNCGCTW